jgi:ribulose-5-phosphate 4-epimerase/fuculose-1-phosphate aldolase
VTDAGASHAAWDQDLDLRRRLADGCRVLASEDMGDFIWGHVSVRASAPGAFWLKGAQMGLEEVTPEDVVLVDLDGKVLAGTRPRHVEWPIHAELYRARSDVGSVVHSHASATVAFGATDMPLEDLGHEASRWTPPDVPRFVETSDLIDSPERGRAVAAAIGSHGGALLRHHGMVVGGPDIPTACLQAIFLEQACRLQLTLMGLGVPYTTGSPDDRQIRHDKLTKPTTYPTLWAYLLRRLERDGSGPAEAEAQRAGR